VDLTYQLERTDRAPGEARRLLALDLRAYPAELVSRACLAVSELVTNSVIHGPASGSFGVHVVVQTWEDTVRVEVRNELRPFEFVEGLPSPGSISGRGLFVVGSVADRWGIEADGTTRVWAEFDLAGRVD
jgi:anti-sigma regulatory factor (Ser/Thr protein kinase)